MNKRLLLCSLLLLFFPLRVLGQFEEVAPGKEFSFPRDHGAHNDFPVEWWYFTGHLQGKESKRTFGFELTFFRVAVNRSDRMSISPWHTQSIFLAHAALTDDTNRRFLFEKRLSRPAFGKAGASEERLSVWLDDWRVEQVQLKHPYGVFDLRFEAIDARSSEPFSLQLKLTSEKAPILQGENGYSQKGELPSDASYYISFTRLVGDGELKIGGEQFTLSASAWMDHEVLSSQPNDEEVGWDWFAIQLDNGWECMLYHLKRGKSLEVSPYSAGSCVTPDGEKIPLSLGEYSIQALSSWKSPYTGITYPSSWRVRIEKVGADLEVIPTVQDQELASQDAATRNYWEGRCSVSGILKQNDVSGAAYVELVGYSQ